MKVYLVYSYSIQILKVLRMTWHRLSTKRMQTMYEYWILAYQNKTRRLITASGVDPGDGEDSSPKIFDMVHLCIMVLWHNGIIANGIIPKP